MKWHYLDIQFLIATRNNYKKAYKLSIEHDSRLKKRMDDNPGDADYIEAYNRYHILHVAYLAAYNDWKVKGGAQKGETLNLDQLLKLLPGKINSIDWKIQDVHTKGTPRYTQLFPNAHKPFYTGTKETKIAAVETLNGAIGAEVPLAAVKIIVDGLYTTLIDAMAVQSGAKSTTSTASSSVELARIKAMTGQYQNLGFFINKFADNTDMIEPLFDVETLTDPAQTIWKGHLDPLENHPTLIHTFEAGDMMRLKSTGNGGLKAFLASIPGGTDSTPVTTEAHLEKIFDVTNFNVTDYAVHRYLTIINTSDTKETRFLLELY